MKKIAMIAAALALVACGEEKAAPAKAAPAKEAAPAAAPAPAPAAEAAVEIVVEANDAMQFNTAEIKAKAGSKVKLTLKHTGKMPKAAMGHNLVILAQGEDVGAFTQAAGAAGPDKEYLPEGAKVIAATKLIGGGESVTIEFDAPAAGSYDFLCSFPGHFALMKGKFIVE